MSQPFCVDQLNPAGFNVVNVPYKENSRFFPTRETGNLKIKMAEADLSPTTFTSSSASDSDYEISLRTPLKICTEASSDNYRQTQKAMQSLKSAGVRRCQNRSTGSSCHPVELISDQTTENNSQEMAACLFSRKRRSTENEHQKNCYTHYESELKTTHHEKLL